MDKEQISYMVNRFLGWKLPKEFKPDAGITFTKPENEVWWPCGTNLLDANQATQMIEYITSELPEKE